MASEDSNRSVADYFVVAGLPQKNPQLLDECSLEVNLKNGAYQDPITDIAVRVQQTCTRPEVFVISYLLF